MKTKAIFILVIFLFTLSYCKDEVASIDVSHIMVEMRVKRFDKEFQKTTLENIHVIKAKYPYLFPGNVPDSVWIAQKNDSLFVALFDKAQKVYGNFDEEKERFKELFQHIKYYYPKFKSPQLITLISELDIDNQLIYADTLMLLSLDTYLGIEDEVYGNYPDYFCRSFDKRQITIHAAKAIAKETQPDLPYRVFLDRIVAFGQLYYSMSRFVPKADEASLFSYSNEKLRWAIDNEESIWKYFVEKEYLYSTDKELVRRFLDPAPFSKFYMGFDNQSPGRVGEWLGYRIVKSYMENNDVSLPEMMATPPDILFKKSKYKPKR